MNDELPRLDAPPVAPPAGAFEVVVRRARLRRRRRLSMMVAVVAVVGLAGAGLAGRGSSDEDITTAGDPEAAPTTTARARATSTTAVHSTTTAVVDVPATTAPSVASGSTTSTSTSTTIEGVLIDVCCPGGAPPDEPPPDETQQVHAGRVVDSAGAPLSGIYVYRYDGMMASGAETQTDLDGRFEVPCGNRPLLLWGVGPSVHHGQTTPDQNWAPVVLGDLDASSPPPCIDLHVAGEDVTMVPGVTVTGLLFDGEGNPRPNMTGYFTLRVGNRVRGLSVRSTDASGRYWLHGLPTGSLRAENNGLYPTAIEAGSGDVVYVDWGPRDEDGTIGPIIPGTPP